MPPLAPPTQQEDVSRFFSGFSSAWDRVYGGRRTVLGRALDAALRRDIGERYRLTFKTLGPDLRGKVVLDVGCGSGVYAIEAARRGAARVIGIDLAPGMIALARQRADAAGVADVCRFTCSGFPLAPPAAELTADYAIVMGVMDYVPAPGPFLRALRATVRERAVISFPDRDRVRYPLRRWRYRLLGRCAVFHYTGAEVRALCREAGFAEARIDFLAHSGGCFFTTVSGAR